MKYAITDTETSGLFDFSKPADAEGQPRLCHLCMVLVDEDGQIEREIDLHVKPDGWTLDPESQAAKVNGLTQEWLEENGTDILVILEKYTEIIDAGYVIAAFNAQFDTKIMRAELRRAGLDDRFETTPNICLMKACIGICKIPKARGNGYKFPKLSEACAHFKIEPNGEHNASDDAHAAVEIFHWLKRLDCLPEPSVKYAKNRPEAVT